MVSDSGLPPSSSNGSALDTREARAGLGGTLGPEERHSPREAVFRGVMRGLYEGRYEPGQRLVEAELTASYRVSRGPVREALNRLAAAGVVELTLQRGAQVRVLTLAEAIDTLVVAQGLIAIAARLAAARVGQPGAAERMKAALEAIDSFDPGSESAEYALARNSFYATLTALAGNAELRRILPTVQVHLIRVQFRAVLRHADRRRHSDYRRIAEAVLAGHATAAEAAAAKHLGRAIAALEEFVQVGQDRINAGLSD